MKGTWETTEGSGGLLVPVACIAVGVLLAGGGAVAAVAHFLTVLVITAGVVVLAVLALAAWVLVRMYRRGQLAPVVAWQPHAAIPAPEAEPVTGRVARALPEPQTVTNNYFYGVTPEQVADAIARQQRVTERDPGSRRRHALWVADSDPGNDRREP